MCDSVSDMGGNSCGYGGFGDLGIGNPHSYGGQQSVGSSGFGGGYHGSDRPSYSDKNDNSNSGNRTSTNSSHTNTSPASHLDDFARALSVNGGPPPGVSPSPEIEEAYDTLVKNLIDNASNFIGTVNTTIVTSKEVLEDLINNRENPNPEDL